MNRDNSSTSSEDEIEVLESQDEIVCMDRIRREEVGWSRRIDLAVIVNPAKSLNKRRCE